MNISGIYKIQSICKPERIYIGSAININKRWRKHLADLKAKRHKNPILQSHYNKYGVTDLEFSILAYCEISELIQNEQFYMDSYKTYFNICPVAGSNLGRKCSEKTKQLLREIRLKQPNPRPKGTKTSEETKEKLRLANIGKKYSEETKRKLSEAHKNPSQETRLKLSNARKGKKRSEEYREKMHKMAIEKGWNPPSRKGVVMSEEEREKMKRIRRLNKQLKVA
jgi:group I intron endonuclease